jgi:signal transduction histidine kinase
LATHSSSHLEGLPSAGLVDAQRWACAVSLMESLVHEVRNPLNAMAINVEVLQEKLARASGGSLPTTGPAKNLQAMREQVVRVNALLGQFAEFIAPPPGPPAEVTLVKVVEEAAALLGHASRRARVRLGVDLGPDSRPVHSPDPALLNFLVLRPLLRALERTPEEGRVQVTLRSERNLQILEVQDGGSDTSGEGPTEAAIGAVAQAQGVELHLRGRLLRLSFPTQPMPRTP